MAVTAALFSFFFFNDTATTEIYTLSLHDALPISPRPDRLLVLARAGGHAMRDTVAPARSEEHTSELQSPDHLVCRLLLEKKKNCKSRDTFINDQIYPVLLTSRATMATTTL